ncbi:molecular chaperone [Morganella psychrotolerans]|uniref:Molecular chaperone n=1 Tax=Morganella psychrotolerans TaxID=368603 RepID=A0A5M9R1K1_9GAMM|nr:molecular chaperone [Morganella psychrotolerans]KAA8714814.1 molecular chaperone [Morganella psychrotolerans]
MKKHIFNNIIFTTLFLFAFNCHAQNNTNGIILNKTRVIIVNDTDSLSIKNNSDNIYLIKSDILTGPEINDKKNDSIIISPPLLKIKGNETKTIKLWKKKHHVSDREDIAYLSVLAIPSTPESHINNDYISVGLRSVIKVFIRPASLPELTHHSVCNLNFEKTTNKQVTTTNTTAYFITISEVIVNDNENILDRPVMIYPFDNVKINIAPEIQKIKWRYINDYGTSSEYCDARIKHN